MPLKQPVYITATPPAPLCSLVEAYSYWEGAVPSDHRMNVVATASMSVQINLSGPSLRWYEGGATGTCHRLQGITFSGVHTGPFGIDAHQPRIVRLVFKPGGAHPFLGPTASELRNAVVSGDDLWGSAAERLRERLAEAPDASQVFDRLTDFLLKSAIRPLNNHRAVSMVLSLARRSVSPPGIGALADAAGMSRKRLIQLFADEVGLPPKRYLRLVRFERLLRAVHQGLPESWAAAAVEQGYFDQPHLIRDFREFTGMVPSAYLARRTDWHNAVDA